MFPRISDLLSEVTLKFNLVGLAALGIKASDIPGVGFILDGLDLFKLHIKWSCIKYLLVTSCIYKPEIPMKI